MNNRFFDFLRLNGAFMAFFRNVGMPPKQHLVRMERRASPIHGIFSGAFSWSTTPEGGSYWSRLSTEWETYCDVKELRDFKDLFY